MLISQQPLSLTVGLALILLHSAQQSVYVCVFLSLNQKHKELRIEMVQLQNENMQNKFCFHVANISPLGETKRNSTTLHIYL